MDTPQPRPASRLMTTLLVAGGICFAGFWITAHVIWASMSFMASVMANDSGTADTSTHMTLIVGMLGGQVIAGAAGIPGGLAWFWRGRRKLLIGLFAILFVTGALWQVWAFNAFFSAAASR